MHPSHFRGACVDAENRRNLRFRYLLFSSNKLDYWCSNRFRRFRNVISDPRRTGQPVCRSIVWPNGARSCRSREVADGGRRYRPRLWAGRRNQSVFLRRVRAMQRARSTRTEYRFDIGNLDVAIVHETETEQDFPSVEIPEVCIVANQLDELILALLEVRRDMKTRGHATSKPRKATPSVTKVLAPRIGA